MLMENKSAMEITALVVDDEPAARRRLRSLIETDPEVRIVGECGDGIRAAEMIGQLKPNLMGRQLLFTDAEGISWEIWVHSINFPSNFSFVGGDRVPRSTG